MADLLTPAADVGARAAWERFDPLPRVLAYDDFSDGIGGWAELCGNHTGDLGELRASFRDLRPPQLSTLPFFDIGSHGAMTGTYALKLATRPVAGHTACLIKRLTLRREALVRFETYFAVRPEARQADNPYEGRAWDGNVDPSEYDLGAFTVSNDIGRFDGSRYHCALRYLNTTVDGRLAQGWYAKTSLQPTTKMQLAGDVPAGDFHTLREDDWQPIPGGDGPLCFNEVPTKVNWHYLRWTVDTAAGRNVGLQVNDRVLDLRDIDVPVYPHPYSGLRGLFNLLIDVRTHRPVRNYLFLDTCVISADW